MEVWTENSRIVLDFGMPLIDRDGKDFDFGTYKNLDIRKLVELGILPDIQGLYSQADPLVNGVVISHPHTDHYGLSNFIPKGIKH